jgi:hypothetical protein
MPTERQQTMADDADLCEIGRPRSLGVRFWPDRDADAPVAPYVVAAPAACVLTETSVTTFQVPFTLR